MAYDFYISKKAPIFVQLYGKRKTENGPPRLSREQRLLAGYAKTER